MDGFDLVIKHFTDAIILSAEKVMKMQFEQLRSVARVLFKGANQRYTRLQKLNLTFTPALDACNDGGGKFYIGKYVTKNQLNALRAEVFRAQSFVKMKTSTVSEARKYDARIKEVLGGDKITKDSGSRVWELYRKAEQENYAGIQVYGSDNVAQVIYQSMEKMDDDTVLAYVRDILKQSYERAEEEMENAMASDVNMATFFF